jgi:ABC-type polysaccharide/polyol phosphate transport system ATPase subunit
LSRITEADRGVIRTRGKVASLLGAGVGFNDEMTGRENVYLNGSILGMTAVQISQRMDAIAEFAEIPHFLDAPVKRYSSGMKARLGFSVAINLDADLMILDEVFATGDMVFRNKCIACMKQLAQSGRTVLVVTHMPQFLVGVCDRGIVLDSGSIVFDGAINGAIDVYLNSDKELDASHSSDIKSETSASGKQVENLNLEVENGEYDRGYIVKTFSNPVFYIRFNCSFGIQKGVLVITLRSKDHGTLGRVICPLEPVGVSNHKRQVMVKVQMENFPFSETVGRIGSTIELYEFEGGRHRIGVMNELISVKTDDPRMHQGVVGMKYKCEILEE